VNGPARSDDPDPLAPSNILALHPYQPGKPIEELERELGAAWPKAGAIKLASNENALGASPRAAAAAREAMAQVHLYPDGAAFRLRARLAAHLGVDEREVAVGAGSNELIDLLVRAFLDEDEEVVAPAHAFICYRLAAQTHRRAYREAPNGSRFAIDVDAVLARVTPRTKLLFIANPNNPTGAYLGHASLERLCRALPPRVILALDEAYVEYVDAADYPDGLRLRATRERLVLLRTFSKVYGLAGLRVGYAVAPAPLVELLDRVRMPFNVSSIAQAAAVAALDDQEHVARSRALVNEQRPRLSAGISALGFDVFPSVGNFLLIDVPRGRSAAGVYAALLRRGVIVRPLQPYGLQTQLRVTVGTAAENARLLDALAEVTA
jgi:histidinol-phosphate aminotransferase